MDGKRWFGKVGMGFGAAVLVALTAMGCKGKKTLGQDCTTDLECADPAGCSTAGNICSKACTYDKDCGGDLVCRRKDDSSGNWCSKAIGAAPNNACMETGDCQHNECLKYVAHPEQPGLCTKYCATADDCPAGMKICDKISDTGLLKVCLPGDPAAPASARPQFGPAPRGKGGGNAKRAPAPAAPPPPPVPAPAPAPAPHKKK
jgi:hypothetical protein